MSDERDPRLPDLRVPGIGRGVRPVGAPRPTRRIDDATRVYRDAERAPTRPRPTDAGRLLVGQIMSRPVITLPRGARAGTAAALMDERRFRHMPIVDANERLVGLVSQSDLFRLVRARPAEWAEVEVGEVMTAEVVTLTPDQSLHAAAQLLAARHLYGGPVVDPTRRPVGFLSARDLLQVMVNRAPLTLWV